MTVFEVIILAIIATLLMWLTWSVLKGYQRRKRLDADFKLSDCFLPADWAGKPDLAYELMTTKEKEKKKESALYDNLKAKDDLYWLRNRLEKLEEEVKSLKYPDGYCRVSLKRESDMWGIKKISMVKVCRPNGKETKNDFSTAEEALVVARALCVKYGYRLLIDKDVEREANNE